MNNVTNTDVEEPLNGIGVLDSKAAESHRHPLSAGLGAVLAAGTAGATAGMLAGPVGAIVGVVVGAVAGGLGGEAIAELIQPDSDLEPNPETYTTRIHHPHPQDDEKTIGFNTGLCPRESWSRLDQSSKELLADNQPISNDS